MKDEAPSDQDSRSYRTAARAIMLAMLALFCGVILQHYSIRAYSDPHNWLDYALRFDDEVLQSRWPYGFPLFLRLVLAVSGPYLVFLVNLPLLVLIFLMIAAFGRRLEPDRDSLRMAVYPGLAALMFAVSADARNFIHYVNPYRDPLSYALLFAAMMVFVSAVQRGRPWRMLGAGLLTGMACSVREPSILMIAPFALYGLVAWDKQRFGWGRMGMAVSAFALAMIFALIPFAIQTYLATAQALVPPQAAMEGQIVPGAHLSGRVFGATARATASFFWTELRWLSAFALIGFFIAAWKRQKELLFLIAPACLVYGLFYSFYWTFVARYFYIVTLLLCLPAGYAVAAFSRALAGSHTHRRQRAVTAVAVLALVSFSVLNLLRAPMQGDGFQIPQARAFTSRIAPLLPADAVVLAPRHLCELINVVVRRSSYPVPYIPGENLSAVESARRHVEGLLASNVPVYLVEIPAPDRPLGDSAGLQRYFDLTPVDEFDPRDFNMTRYAEAPFRLLKIEPFGATAGTRTLSSHASPGEPAWIAVDLSALALMQDAGTAMAMRVCDRSLTPEEIARGSFFVGTDQLVCEPAGEVLISWSAPVPVPRMVSVTTAPLSKPVDLRFDFFNTFDYALRWGGDVIPADAVKSVPRIAGPSAFVVPVPAPSIGRALLEWRLRSSVLAPGRTMAIEFRENQSTLATFNLPLDRGVHSALVALPSMPETGERRIEIRPRTDATNIMAEVHRLLVHRPGAARDVAFRIGEVEDTPYIKDGFYRREGWRTGNPFRWMTPRGELSLPVADPGRDRLLAVEFNLEGIPAPVLADPEWGIRMEFNGRPMDPALFENSEKGPTRSMRIKIPGAEIRDDNSLVIHVPGWSPAKFGAGDRRELGLQVSRIEFTTDGEGGELP